MKSKGEKMKIISLTDFSLENSKEVYGTEGLQNLSSTILASKMKLACLNYSIKDEKFDSL